MITFQNVGKSFKQKAVLNDITLEIQKGEFVVLIGPSGCGKTTTLKMINKLIQPSTGTILIDGNDISKIDSIQLRRGIGYVIQQTGLFPHMTIGENVGLVPKLKGIKPEEIKERTENLLQLVGLPPEEYIDRYPFELSGGQQQRVGVARAYATDAEIILMDEPFSALDPITRNQLQDELYNLQQEMKKTIVFVTHDMDEALKLGDRICIMKDGHILQYDTPENILKYPSNDFVEEFVGKNRIWQNPEYIHASDIMIHNPIKTVANRTVVQAVEIMQYSKVDSLLIVNKHNHLQGIVTLKDLRRAENRSQTIVEFMQQNIQTVKDNDSLLDILEKMNNYNIGYIPVTNNENKLVGLITKSSLLSVLSNQYINEEVTV